MSGKPFDRRIINTKERPVSADVLLGVAQSDYALRGVLRSMMARRSSDSAHTSVFDSGFIGDGFMVKINDGPNRKISVTAGHGFIEDATSNATAVNGVSGLDDNYNLHPVVLASDEPITVDAGDGAAVRVDIIEVKVDRYETDSANVEIWNTVSKKFEGNVKNKTLSFTLDGRSGRVVAPSDSTTGIGYKVGVPGAGAPATTTGYVKIAEIYVPIAAASLTDANLCDYRRLCLPGGCGSISMQVTRNIGGASASAANILTPPGWRATAAVRASPAGACRVYLIGGRMNTAKITPILSYYSGSGTTALGGGIDAGTITQTVVDSTLQTNLAAATPAINVGIGQPVCYFNPFPVAGALPDPTMLHVLAHIQQ